MNRILAKKTGNNNHILFIILGAIHGNEPVGVKAIEKLFSVLENVSINGTLVGIIGNKKAYSKGVRFIEHDLNRLFHENTIEESYKKKKPTNEYKELVELLVCIKNEIKQTQPKKIFLIDVHSTSADSPLFSIVNNDTSIWKLATEMNVPVVTGMVGKLMGGSTLDYFITDNFNIPFNTISIEAGQHTDSATIQHAFLYLFKILQHVGVIEKLPENQLDNSLPVKNLPSVVQFAYRHSIIFDDDFIMKPNYKSFQAVKKGEILGTDKNGDVISTQDGFILMPLYQKQGHDGFFLVEEM